MASSSFPNTNGKVVVITGASAGIGEAAAKTLSTRGAKVVLVARREELLKQVAASLTGESLVVVADVTKRADVERILAESIAKFGHVDVWINNAGRGIGCGVLNLTDEDLDEMILVNVKSALYGMQVAAKHFIERKSGHLINISSVLSRLPFASFRSAYSASKHMLNSLTVNARQDLKAQSENIHVTLYMPGVVATDFGSNARGVTNDSRAFPGAQPVDEVGVSIADAVETPRAEVYSRHPAYKDLVSAYYGAEDVAVIESRPPWVQARPAAAPASSS